MQCRKPYPTDLNDTEWPILTPLIPAAKPGGRPEVCPQREIINAILMAAGLTDHVWTLREVLLFRVPPWPQPAGV